MLSQEATDSSGFANVMSSYHRCCHGNTGACLYDDTCECAAGYRGADCSLYDCATVNQCSGHGQCTRPKVCTCEVGWTGAACATPSCGLAACSGNGVCVAPGQCNCTLGFVGQHCEVATVCSPTVRNCSGHGLCDGSGTCHCYSLFTGGSACKTP